MDGSWKPRDGSGWKCVLAPTGLLWSLEDGNEKEPLHVMILGGFMCVSRSSGAWSHKVPSIADMSRVEEDFGVEHWTGLEVRPCPPPAMGELLMVHPHRKGAA